VKKFYTFFSIAVSFILAQYSCSKIDTTTLGSNLIPDVDNVNTFDTILDVISHNILLGDSTTVLYNENHALGAISNDPAFGSTKADIYFSVAAPSYRSTPFYNKDSIINIDSVVLMMAYKGAYGDSTIPQGFTVSEIDQAANFKDSVSGYPISSPDFPLAGSLQSAPYSVNIRNLNDSFVVIRKKDTSKLVSVMRIPLSKILGQRLAGYDTTNAYKSDSAFRTYFKGISVKTNGTGGALSYFSLSDANTKLIVYYRVSRNGAPDTTEADFAFSPYKNANIIRRTPASGYAASLSNSNPNNPDIYIQTSPGSYATIKIPGLKGLNNRVIHRAELIIERETAPGDATYLPPSLVFLDAIDSANSNRIIALPNYDFSAQSGFYNVAEFGGSLLKDNTYRFNLSRYVQGIVTRGETPFTLRLYSSFYTRPYYKDPTTGAYVLYGINLSNKISYGRIVLKGGGYPDPAKKMRLRIIYSKI
jgi:hypothetical protein